MICAIPPRAFEDVLEDIRRAESAIAHAFCALNEPASASHEADTEPHLHAALRALYDVTIALENLRDDHQPKPGAEEGRAA